MAEQAVYRIAAKTFLPCVEYTIMVSQPWVAPFVKEPSLLRKLRRAGIYLIGFEKAIELGHLNIDNGNVSSSQHGKQVPVLLSE